MIKENQRLFNQLHVLSDGVLVALSVYLAYWLRFTVLHGVSHYPLRDYFWLALAAAVLCLCSYAVAGLYASHRSVPLEREAQSLFLATALDALLLMTALFIFRLTELSRWLVVIFGAASYALLMAKRIVLRQLLRHYRRLGYNQKHVLLIGAGDLAERYVDCVRENPELGFLIDGYVSDTQCMAGLPWLSDYAGLEALLEAQAPDEVVLAVPPEEHSQVGRVIALCEKTGVKLSLIPHYAPYMPSNPQVDSIGGLPMINLRRIPLDNKANAFLKRGADIAGALVLILLTSPLMLAAALGVKLSSPGPVLFKQERVGRNRAVFSMYKFRSMRVNDRQETGWSQDSDPRKTRFGALIRKLSIDELPQFFNVLKGDMSLVGPRPEIPFYVDRFKEEIPRYMVKHQVRPGITGWAQVNGYRGDTSIRKRIEYDLYYIENWSVFFDIKILLLTLTRLINSERLH